MQVFFSTQCELCSSKLANHQAGVKGLGLAYITKLPTKSVLEALDGLFLS